MSRGFDAVLVDEYQDTNALQALLYQCLANDDGSNLFFVGDVKQSIYRFRLASPEIFIGKRGGFAPYTPGGPHPATVTPVSYTHLDVYKRQVQDRADIVESAKKEAEAIVKRAEDRARAMVAQEAIVKAAQQKATEILTSAQSQSREMRTTVTNYCENMLRHTEEQLAKSMTEVKTVRSTLRQSGKKATVRPAAQPQKPE